MNIGRSMLRNGLILWLFAVVGTGVVAVTFEGTRTRIAANERQALLHSLHQVIAPDSHDNDIFTDTIEVRDPRLSADLRPVTVYRARKDGQPVAVVIATVAPDGYAGPVKLLVGIRTDGTLSGVRVIAHKETPGLGDAIDLDKSDWVLAFAGKSLADPGERGWHVKKDGGVFDQFTGATITPRIVVKAVHNTLLYFQQHRDELFAAAPPAEAEHG